MEVLRSGSFVNLESREKIEQLIFTAKELAVAASRTDGFVSGGDANQRLALQMWDGAEYVCRDSEVATIKNIFLSNFLQKLREVIQQVSQAPPLKIEAAAEPPLAVTPSASAPIVPEPLASEGVAFVQQPPELVVELDEDESTRARSYSDECVPEGEVEALVAETEEEEVSESVATSQPSSVDDDAAIAESRIEEDGDAATDEGAKPVETIVLKEKEPYNFESCTVTAVVQLLPESEGTRKCVVSIRTHDFSPLVTIGDTRVAETIAGIANSLGRAFDQYRNELPARAAEKIKKETPAPKKASKTPPVKAAKAAAVASKTSTPQPTTSAASPNQDQQGLFGA